MNTKAIFDSVLKHSHGYSMGALWQSLTVELSGGGVSFGEQTEIFFSFLKMLLDRGEIRFALDGSYLDGTVDEQLGVLRHAWPTGGDELESEMDFWFLADAPAGIVWITPDGQEIWT